MVEKKCAAEEYTATVSEIKRMASQKDHILCCTATFVTQRTFVRLAPQDLCALNMSLFALPFEYNFLQND